MSETSTIEKPETKPETRKFDAEIGKVLKLMINSLYTNKDIFLRELISNASDACDKLRYNALTNGDLLSEDTELKIKLFIDKEARTLTIADNGIGMNHDELIDNLGTIARSGTQQFLESMTGDSKKDAQLIGQFGVGFYSSFMVADKVTVISRKAGEDKSWVWTSNGEGEFTIEENEKDAPRGTFIQLHLREGEDAFIDKHHLKYIVTTYSDHISVPIVYINEELENKEVLFNSASALWTKPKSDISDEEYQQFYKNVAHSNDEPWAILHNKVEGTIEYTNLLFIPSSRPFDLFHPDRKTSVKLYVKRVFITEENTNLIPSYLRFVKGVVDSEDLPLNISRETLQHNALLEKIKKSLVKKILSELKKKSNKDKAAYETFWDNFGAVFKEGLCESLENKEKMLELCRFNSTKFPDQLVSLDEYISRMPEDQKHIYFLTGDSVESVQNSPQLEGFIKRDVEVLLMTDTVDDFWVNVVNEFKEKEFKSVTSAGIDLDNTAEEKASNDDADDEENTDKPEVAKEETDTDKLLTYIKTVLGGVIADAKISQKLTDSPVCLAVKEGGMDIRMERFLLDQKQLAAASAKILEVNAEHPVIATLVEDFKKDGANESVDDTIFLLFDQACIVEGQSIADPGAFSKRLNAVLGRALAA